MLSQSENNLVNAFVADRIVVELRDAKLKRQFPFATHNAIIPVFGDAEWIGVFNVLDPKSNLPVENQESIDLDGIRESSVNVLEGERVEFVQGKEKYGF